MADIAAAFISGHQAGRQQVQEQEDRKLRQLILKHELDRMKVEDAITNYKTQFGHAQSQFELQQGQPAPTIGSVPQSMPTGAPLGTQGTPTGSEVLNAQPLPVSFPGVPAAAGGTGQGFSVTPQSSQQLSSAVAAAKLRDLMLTAHVLPEGANLVVPSLGTIATGQPKPPPNPTGAEDDAKFERIQTAFNLHQPITKEDAAWADAYRTRKLMGPESVAAAASDRQSKAIGAQIAQQGRQQSFVEAQAGRSELTQKVEQPFLDAAEKAAALRDAVHLAQGGNMVAGALQPLLATLGVTTMEGVKRINSVEIAQTAGAGSIWTRIQGQIGKLVAGQPMPAALQKDLVGLSNLLEKNAYDKYLKGFQQTTKRYNLTDETPLAAPVPAAAPSLALTPGLQGLAAR